MDHFVFPSLLVLHLHTWNSERFVQIFCDFILEPNENMLIRLFFLPVQLCFIEVYLL